MPIRKTEKEVPVTSSGRKHDTLLDLSFLPEAYIKRIDDIFDSYFMLGMKPMTAKMDTPNSPAFPNKVSALTSPELGDKHGEMAAWHSFTLDKLKYVVVAANFMETELSKILDQEVGQMVSDKGNIEAKKAKAKSSSEYILLLSYAQKLRGLKDMLDMECERYASSVSALSREISRRENYGGF